MKKNKNGRHRAALVLEWVREQMLRQSPHWTRQTARRYGIPIIQKRRRVKAPAGEAAR